MTRPIIPNTDRHYSDVTNAYTRGLLGAGLLVTSRKGARRHFDGIPNVTLWLIGSWPWARSIERAREYFAAAIPGSLPMVIRHTTGATSASDGLVIMPFDTAIKLLTVWQQHFHQEVSDVPSSDNGGAVDG